MKALTDRQKLLLNEKALQIKLRWHEWIPKFKIGHKAKIIDIGTISIKASRFSSLEEWETCHSAWTYLDKIREERIGQIGMITSIDVLKVFTIPVQVSPYSYRIKFKDGHEIVFCEPYLKRSK